MTPHFIHGFVSELTNCGLRKTAAPAQSVTGDVIIRAIIPTLMAMGVGSITGSGVTGLITGLSALGGQELGGRLGSRLGPLANKATQKLLGRGLDLTQLEQLSAGLGGGAVGALSGAVGGGAVGASIVRGREREAALHRLKEQLGLLGHEEPSGEKYASGIGHAVRNKIADTLRGILAKIDGNNSKYNAKRNAKRKAKYNSKHSTKSGVKNYSHQLYGPISGGIEPAIEDAILRTLTG